MGSKPTGWGQCNATSRALSDALIVPLQQVRRGRAPAFVRVWDRSYAKVITQEAKNDVFEPVNKRAFLACSVVQPGGMRPDGTRASIANAVAPRDWRERSTMKEAGRRREYGRRVACKCPSW